MTAAKPSLFIEARPEDREAEQSAQACLDRCYGALGFEVVPLPVPVERWIEHPLDIDFGFESIQPRDNAHVLGYADLANRRIRINSDIAEDEERVRWTIAHELGHLELHASSGRFWTDFGGDDDDVASRYRNPIERQADRFAGAFLMPARQVVSELFRLSAEAGLEAQHAIPELVSGSDEALQLWRETFLPRLCRSFGVSRYGAIYRLADLRLFDSAPLLLQRHVHRLV